MKQDFVVSADALGRQRRASDPSVSAWVSANAGAGKTKVLTDRVIRLLLAGSDPSRILCLTFTKAAAAEMTIRVFETLGDWVTLDDPALTGALTKLTGAPPSRAERARARRLFARSVETPGGLKIETIHAFCERLLHLVPFEAQVPARFVVLDDGQAAELMSEARATVLAAAASGRPGQEGLAGALDAVSSLTSGDALTRLLDVAVADARVPRGAGAIADATARLTDAMGLAPGRTADDLRRAMADGGLPASEWAALAAELRTSGKPTDAARAAALDLASRSQSLSGRLVHYRSVFFTEEGTPRASVATKGVAAGVQAALAAEQARLVSLQPALLGAEAVERSGALFRLADAIRTELETVKARLGALDFADLISKTLAVLDRGAGPWVLYKLDRGIDHVLVDEAQDTNGEQWRILRHLTAEFTAGSGRPSRTVRTVFAVGDPKQSIYSFQGADPRLFEDGRRHWVDQHRGAAMGFAEVRLDLSFRSARTILAAVDNTFRIGAHYRGLSFSDEAIGTTHESARPRAPGSVEVWPTEEPSRAVTEPDAWSRPVDLPDEGSPAIAAANRVARAVRCWTGATDPAIGRAWRPGEILILARKRGTAFFAAIRALKAAGIPVAGADRLDINEQIAVNDLVAAGQAALLPANDLVLAAALKSPLAGLDDDDLIRIAADRPDGTSLASALDAAAGSGDARAVAALATLTEWRRLARTLGPFGFYATLLGPAGGRRRLVERLGGEAADAIDVFLSRAQAEEFGPEASSLTGFLARFESASHVIRRDPEAPADEVRVMTVHGAKGLEAPLVVILDGCEVHGPDPELIEVPVAGGGAVPIWARAAATDPPALEAARAALRARGLEEHNRLLYVALTRARDRLVVVPFTDGRGRKEPAEAWCAMVRRGFETAAQPLVRTEMPYGAADLWRDGEPLPEPDAATAASGPVLVPDWLGWPVEPEPEARPPLRPSGPLAAADRTESPVRADRRSAARRRGALVHALLDHVGRRPDLIADPPERRRAAARAYLAARAPKLAADERDAIAAEALSLVSHPDLAALFGPGSRGEVPLSGRIGEGPAERVVSGQMDRLVVTPDAVLVADFKTGTPKPGARAPDAYLAQLALYRELLRRLYPDRPVRTLLVWTAGPVVSEPGEDELDAALARVLAALP